MNTVSWFMYAAEVSDRVMVIFFVLAFALGVSGAVSLFSGSVIWQVYSWDTRERVNAARAKLRQLGVRCLVAAPVAALLFAATPSKQTLYMIAASEMGGKVAATPEAQEIYNETLSTLRHWLREQRGEKKAN